MTKSQSDFLDDFMRSALNKARFLRSEGYCEEGIIHFVRVQMRKAYRELDIDREIEVA